MRYGSGVAALRQRRRAFETALSLESQCCYLATGALRRPRYAATPRHGGPIRAAPTRPGPRTSPYLYPPTPHKTKLGSGPGQSPGSSGPARSSPAHSLIGIKRDELTENEDSKSK